MIPGSSELREKLTPSAANLKQKAENFFTITNLNHMACFPNNESCLMNGRRRNGGGRGGES